MKTNDWQDTIAMAASAIEDLLETADEHAGCWADVPARLRALTAPTAPAVPGAAKVGEMPFLGSSEPVYVKGWNDCRAAMLAQPQIEPQNIPNNIPDGLAAAVNRLLDCDGTRGHFSATRCSDAREEVERLLAQPVSQGYKLVPVEPTEEMIAAAMNCDDVEFNSDETFCVNFDNIYRAMLAAAPEGGNG